MKEFVDFEDVSYTWGDQGQLVLDLSQQEFDLRILAVHPDADLGTARVAWAIPSHPTRVRVEVEVP